MNGAWQGLATDDWGPPVSGSHPPLPPVRLVTQVAPGDASDRLRVHCLQIHELDPGVGRLGHHDMEYQEMFLPGHGLDGSPLAQQQFLGMEGGHGWYGFGVMADPRKG